MKTGCFNLVDKPWLPVTLAPGFPDGASRGSAPRASLREAFEFGDQIVDLRCYAHERIALMRLLICIAQRALNGPETEDDWMKCRFCLAEEAIKYLETYKDCFNLFGDGPRFLQAHGKGNPGTMSVFRLRLIDEDTPTLFDANVQPGVGLEPAELAVALVCFQSFSAGGKVGGSEPSPKGRVTKAGKVKMEPQSGEAALCRDNSALHSFIVKTALLDSIHSNLVCRCQMALPMTWGNASQPIWEYKKTDLADYPEALIRTDYLGRLAPLARAVWLQHDLATAEAANGLAYGVFADSKDAKTKRLKPGTGIRELTASVARDRKARDRDSMISASVGGGVPKSAWRELHSIAVLRVAGNRGGPVALEHLRSAPSEDSLLWCGALVGARAKVGDAVESFFRIPAAFLEREDVAGTANPLKCPGPNVTYRRGVELGDRWERRLQDAVTAYHDHLKDAERGKTAIGRAALRYWTALEPKAETVLLWDVSVQSSKYWKSDGDWMSASPWGQEVRRAARDAYEFACPHTTPRQIRAFAAGLDALLRPPKNANKPEKAEEDTDDGDNS